MLPARALLLALVLSIPAPLLTGCGRAEQRVEDMETEDVRNERRDFHRKLVPKYPQPDD